ncbi:MAG: recombinase family protein [Patescibacteria group bacterium]|nr:MAG: recombinase family protein [Patescibacteria group bacterium]
MNKPTEAVPVRYCLYARKSSEQDERQALSIDAQIKEMLELAEREKLEVVATRRESHSAKDSNQRPEYNRLITDVRAGTFNGILTWAPDRLSRNGGDLGALVDLMDQGKLVEIRTPSQHFTNSPNEKFLLMILCSQAKLENDNRGVNVKRGQRAKVQQGWRPNQSPLGYFNTKTTMKGEQKVLLDPERAPIIKEMFERVSNLGHSGRKIKVWLDEVGFKTRKGKKLPLSMIYLMLRNPYYYGRFEYPCGSGNWFPVAHESIVTEELFNDVQRQLAMEKKKTKWGSKEFAFTRLMKCGACGSGVTAQEKFKSLRDGTRQRYVYYHCGRTTDKDCKEPYVREEVLIEQLVGILDELEIDHAVSKKKFQDELERNQRFMASMLGAEASTKMPRLDHKKYLRHVLINGTKEEKRELLLCVKTSIVLADQHLSVAKR